MTLERRRSARADAGRVVAVTGTNTGVGKTRVTRGLVRQAQRAGEELVPVKLVETGCTRGDDALVPEDGLALWRASGERYPLAIVSPHRFELPAAPSVAARAVGSTLRFEDLVADVDRALGLAPAVLLEGAGGLLVPIGPDGTFGDLLAVLGAPTVVVAHDALGTINHTLLTIEAMERRAIPVLGVVLNAANANGCSLDHARELTALLPTVPVYGPMPWDPEASDDALAEWVSGCGIVERMRTAFGA